MASTLVKVAIGLAGVTTVGGGATFVYLNSGSNKAIAQDESKSNTGTQNQATSPTEVKKQEANTVINKLFGVAKITLLTEKVGDTEAWKTKWTEFKRKYNDLKEKEDWKFDEWSGSGPEDEAGIKALKQKCKDNSTKKVVDQNSPLFLEVREFCTKEVTSD